MEKLFEVIGSLIPEEQQADIKAKIDGVVGEMLKENSTNVKKELSGKYGVNFFEEDINKAYDNKAFIKKSFYEEELKRYETLDTENKTLKQDYDTLQSKIKELEVASSHAEVGVALLKEGFNPERLDSIRPLLSVEGEIADKVLKIKEQLPELFLKSTVISNTNPKKEDENLTGAQEFFKQRKKMLIR